MEANAILLARFDEDFREQAGIDNRTYDALLHVFEAGPSGIRMTDLAHEVVLTKAGLTSLIDRLEERSLLQRVPDPADRRSFRITLTEEGTRVFGAAARIHVAGIRDRVGRHLSDEEAQTVIEVFERIKAANLDPS
ncbi:MarR family winged helix-turn-helix transcriptional regulator [Nocardioides albidus]|nr:MarR family transcriptional regulator [Nocardioides albidus]